MHGFIHTCTPKPGDSTSELGGVNHVSSSPKKAFRYAMSQKKLGPFKLVILGEAQQVWSLSKAPNGSWMFQSSHWAVTRAELGKPRCCVDMSRKTSTTKRIGETGFAREAVVLCGDLLDAMMPSL